MNRTLSTWKKATLVGLGGIVVASLAATDPSLAAPSSTPTTSATATADAALAHTVTYMREEERLARDLYAALAKVHDAATPMANITNSEQNHFDAMGRLVTLYGLTDPSAGLSAGTYAYPELTELYQKLYASGSASLAGAYAAGVAVEQTDIADLKKAIADTTDATADQVFTRLLSASQQHLSAFTAAQSGTTPVRNSSAKNRAGNHTGNGTQARSGRTETGREGTGRASTGRAGSGQGSGTCRNA